VRFFFKKNEFKFILRLYIYRKQYVINFTDFSDQTFFDSSAEKLLDKIYNFLYII
jgi:hypothetical protein